MLTGSARARPLLDFPLPNPAQRITQEWAADGRRPFLEQRDGLSPGRFVTSVCWKARSAAVHEMGIAMQVMQIAIDAIPAEMEDVRVERVNLKVGKLAAVVPESLRFCFGVITPDTPLAGAELAIEEVPVTAACTDCDHFWTVTGPVFKCPSCGGGAVEIHSGQELSVVSIEIADPPEDAPSESTPQSKQ